MSEELNKDAPVENNPTEEVYHAYEAGAQEAAQAAQAAQEPTSP